MESQIKDENILIKLSKEEALVFFDWLSKFNENDANKVDLAEERLFFDFESILESILPEPFLQNYLEILKKAKLSVQDLDSN